MLSAPPRIELMNRKTVNPPMLRNRPEFGGERACVEG